MNPIQFSPQNSLVVLTGLLVIPKKFAANAIKVEVKAERNTLRGDVPIILIKSKGEGSLLLRWVSTILGLCSVDSFDASSSADE